MKKSYVRLGSYASVSMAAVAQDVPKFEVPLGFSFVNVHPGLTPSPASISSVVVADCLQRDPLDRHQGRLQWLHARQRTEEPAYGLGYPTVGNVQGNVFTYMFGPQIKKHSGKLQPFGQALFGAAHSNVYANVVDTINGIIS